jgi:Cu2+-containing amine oxidase
VFILSELMNRMLMRCMISTLENIEFNFDAIVYVDDMLEQRKLLRGILTKYCRETE